MVKRFARSTRSRRFTRFAKKTRKALRKNRHMKRVRLLRQKGGDLQFDSVSKENEEDTVVTVFPDSREPELAPMTGRLSLIREIVDSTAV
jgi:hypothetical protein